MQGSAWPCLFHVFLGQGDAGSILMPDVPLGTSSTWHSLLKSMDLDFLGIFCLAKTEIK